MPDKDRLYLERRAEDELNCAQQAEHPAAVKAHYELLGYYLNRLYPEQRWFGGRSRLYSH